MRPPSAGPRRQDPRRAGRSRCTRAVPRRGKRLRVLSYTGGFLKLGAHRADKLTIIKVLPARRAVAADGAADHRAAISIQMRPLLGAEGASDHEACVAPGNAEAGRG